MDKQNAEVRQRRVRKEIKRNHPPIKKERVELYGGKNEKQDCAHHEPSIFLERKRCRLHEENRAGKCSKISADHDHRTETDQPKHFALKFRIQVCLELQ